MTVETYRYISHHPSHAGINESVSPVISGHHAHFLDLRKIAASSSCQISYHSSTHNILIRTQPVTLDTLIHNRNEIMTETTAQHSEDSAFLPRSRSARVRDCKAQLSSFLGTVHSRPSDPASQRSDADNLTTSVAITPIASSFCQKRRPSLSPSDITNFTTAILM